MNDQNFIRQHPNNSSKLLFDWINRNNFYLRISMLLQIISSLQTGEKTMKIWYQLHRHVAINAYHRSSIFLLSFVPNESDHQFSLVGHAVGLIKIYKPCNCGDFQWVWKANILMQLSSDRHWKRYFEVWFKVFTRIFHLKKHVN